MKQIKLIELFAGIGSQAMALRDIGADFITHKVIEFDKYAIASYNAIHGTNFPTMDITKIHADDLEIKDTENFNYIMTYSFPCQDLSVAGRQAGMQKNSGTRSGLLWEVERLLNECDELPQTLVMENVTQVHGTKNKADFMKWCEFLQSKGYSNYWQDLNAKDFGIPQNRNRCFMISKLNDNTPFVFPKPQELEHPMRDLLESEVDEKYYIKNKTFTFDNVQDKDTVIVSQQGKKIDKQTDVASCLMARDYKGFGNQGANGVIEKRCQQVGSVDIGNNESNNRVYSSAACCPTLNTMQGGHRQPKILEAEKDEVKIIDDTQGFEKEPRIYKGCAPTLRAQRAGLKVEADYKVRKLTPLECWRLMGFTDEDFKKAAAVCSNTQLYKQAGNSIVKNVLMAIFKNLIM